MMSIAVVVVAVTLWGVVHSWLASSEAKGLARRQLGERPMRAYRLAYNAFAAISFVPVLALLRALPDEGLYVAKIPWLYLMLAGQVAAACLLALGLLQTDPLYFIGFRHTAKSVGSSRLVITGLYRWVRHPLYLFGLILLWLTPAMTVNLLTVFIMLTAYIFIGATLEERRLVEEFGDSYIDYSRRTPMIVPGLRLKPPPGQDTPGPANR
jgi:protein-S-isoprenylcysteine O-methyltransferase Ste14